MKRRSTPQKDFISLEDNTAEANRYKNPSSTKNYLLTTRAVEQSDTKAVTYHKRARNASSWAHPVIEDSTLNVATASSVPVSLVDGMAEKRKAAIEYFYVNIYGSPDDIDSIVTPIMKTLCIPKGSYYPVKKILQDLKAEKENPDAYVEKKDGRGRKPFIQDFSDEAKLIYEMAERGIGNPQIAAILNTRRFTLCAYI